MKVYIVQDGDYEGCDEVDAVFSSFEKALTFARQIYSSRYNDLDQLESLVSEIELDKIPNCY